MKLTHLLIAGAAIVSLTGCYTENVPPIPLHNQCLAMQQQISIYQQMERHNYKDISPVKIRQLQTQYMADNCQMVLGHNADVAKVN